MYPVTDAFRAAVVSGSADRPGRGHGDPRRQRARRRSRSRPARSTCDGTRDGALRSLSLTVAPDEAAFDWLAAAGAEIVVARGLRLADAATSWCRSGSSCSTPTSRRPRTGRSPSPPPTARSASAAPAGRTRTPSPPAPTSATALGDLLRACWPGCPVGTTLDAIERRHGREARLPRRLRLRSLEGRPRARRLGRLRPLLRRRRRGPGPGDARPGVGPGLRHLLRRRDRHRARARRAPPASPASTTASSSPPKAPAWARRSAARPGTTIRARRPTPTGRWGASRCSTPRRCSRRRTSVDSAAETMLARVKRPIEQTAFELVPNPAHEAFDVIELVDEDGTAGATCWTS